MNGLPRILTIDPTGEVARLVRAVVELTDKAFIQTHVPTADAALTELETSRYDLVVAALQLYAEMDGMTLAQHVQAQLPDTRFIIIGGNDVESTFDERLVLLSRPFEPKVLVETLMAGANGESMLPKAPVAVSPSVDYGPVPALSLSGVAKIIDTLTNDLAALSLLLVTREGEVLLERGTEKQIDRDSVAQALLPAMTANIHMGGLVGGKISTMNFYDGDKYDIFVLGVGYHHFLCLIFDGKYGAKQLGAIRTYAQRAAQDIVALLGAQAYAVPSPVKASSRGRSAGERQASAPRTTRATPAASPETLPDAEPLVAPEASMVQAGAPAAERVALDPIVDFDPSLLDQLQALDTADADVLFDLDRVAELARNSVVGRNLVSGDDAVKRGFVP